jgi:uncharacterized membrane protein
LLQPLAPLTAALQSPATILWLLVLALGPTIGASVAYAAGVRTVPVSVASLIATLEPVLAALLAYLVLGEDPAERKEDQRSKAKVKGSKGEKRDFENNLKVTSRMGSETRR